MTGPSAGPSRVPDPPDARTTAGVEPRGDRVGLSRLATRKTAWIGAVLLVAGVTAVLGYLRLMTSFATYDDEGYMIVTIKEYVARGGLYDDVYSQYGPFFSEFWGAIVWLLGVDLNSNYARGFVLFAWVTTSLLIGFATSRLTRSYVLGVLAQLLTFVTLGSFVNEPLHPGSLTCLLLSLVVVVAAFVVERRPRLGFGLIGGLIATLGLVKINVGALALAAFAVAAMLTLPELASRRLVRWTAVAACVVVPLTLVAGRLENAWTQRYAVVVVASLGAIVVTAWPGEARSRLHGRPATVPWIVAAAASAAAAAVVVCVAAIATGTSVGGLVNGAFVDAVRQSDVLTLPLNLSTGVEDLALLGIAAAAVARHVGLGTARRARPIAMVVAGAVIMWAVADPSLSGLLPPDTIGLAVALPFAWVATVPVHDHGDPARRFLIVFVPTLAVFQTLHAYPVAGSQIAFATFLLVPVGALCLAGSGALWRIAEWEPALALVVAAVLIAKVSFQGVVEPLVAARSTYTTNPSLGLFGANHLHLAPETATTLRGLVDAIERRCSSFVTLPGMNSLYVFTRQRPPTGINATTWMFLFDDARQQRVVDALRGSQRLCVVRNDDLAAAWAQGRPIPPRPLYRFATTGVEPIATFDGYVLERKRRP